MYVIKLKTILCYVLIFATIISAAKICEGISDARAVTAEAEEGSVALPILMYHSVCEKAGKAAKFIVSEQDLRADFEYIKNSGYTTVSSAELIDFAENGTPLPEKPIMITFDDGYYNNYKIAFPLLKEYNMKAVISIIGRYTDLYSENNEENVSYSHITWNEAQEMIDSGLVEIQNHSYNSHTTDKGRNGTKKKKGESEAAYAEYIYSDIGKLQDEINQHLGYRPELFAYPFGSFCEASYEPLKQLGFKVTLSCEEKVNHIKPGDKDGLYMLGRYLRPHSRSAEKILKKAE